YTISVYPNFSGLSAFTSDACISTRIRNAASASPPAVYGSLSISTLLRKQMCDQAVRRLLRRQIQDRLCLSYERRGVCLVQHRNYRDGSVQLRYPGNISAAQCLGEMLRPDGLLLLYASGIQFIPLERVFYRLSKRRQAHDRQQNIRIFTQHRLILPRKFGRQAAGTVRFLKNEFCALL